MARAPASRVAKLRLADDIGIDEISRRSARRKYRRCADRTPFGRHAGIDAPDHRRERACPDAVSRTCRIRSQLTVSPPTKRTLPALRRSSASAGDIARWLSRVITAQLAGCPRRASPPAPTPTQATRSRRTLDDSTLRTLLGLSSGSRCRRLARPPRGRNDPTELVKDYLPDAASPPSSPASTYAVHGRRPAAQLARAGRFAHFRLKRRSSRQCVGEARRLRIKPGAQPGEIGGPERSGFLDHRAIDRASSRSASRCMVRVRRRHAAIDAQHRIGYGGARQSARIAAHRSWVW